jgi:hypothetical protein
MTSAAGASTTALVLGGLLVTGLPSEMFAWRRRASAKPITT